MPMTCPKCNSENIDHYDTSFEEFDELEQFVECLDCKFKWTELFKCVKWYPDRGNEIYNDDNEYEPNEKYAANKEHKDDKQGTKDSIENVESVIDSTLDKSLEVI